MFNKKKNHWSKKPHYKRDNEHPDTPNEPRTENAPKNTSNQNQNQSQNPNKNRFVTAKNESAEYFNRKGNAPSNNNNNAQNNSQNNPNRNEANKNNTQGQKPNYGGNRPNNNNNNNNRNNNQPNRNNQNRFNNNRPPQNREPAVVLTKEQIFAESEKEGGQDDPNAPICAICGVVIRNQYTAMKQKEGGNLCHFDCIVKELSQTHAEKLGKGKNVYYVGAGNFAIVRENFDRRGYLRGYEILERIPYETKEN